MVMSRRSWFMFWCLFLEINWFRAGRFIRRLGWYVWHILGRDLSGAGILGGTPRLVLNFKEVI